MQARKGLSLLGLGVASGAVLVIPTAASAAPGASHQYNSTASAKGGSISVAGNNQIAPGNSVTATDSNGSQGSSTGAPSGLPLPGGLGTVIPKGANLITTHAQASASGTSSACSAVAAGDCVNGSQQAQPLEIRVSLEKLLQAAGGSGGLPIGTLPGNIGNFAVVLDITGPAAECVAGPPGSPAGAFKAAETSASGAVDLQNGRSSVIGGAKTISANGDVLASLTNGPLSAVLSQVKDQVMVTFVPGQTSGSGSGPKTTAEAGQAIVKVGGSPAVSLTGGSVSCGPNPAKSSPPRSPSTTTTSPVGPASSQPTEGTSPGGPTTTSDENPLKSIQTDEGRWTPAADETPMWAGLAAAGVALAGGCAFWWRRRRMSGS